MLTRAPLVPIAIAFATGIALGDAAPTRLLWPAAIALLALSAVALAIRRTAVAAILLVAAIVTVGALRAASLPLALDHVARGPLPRTATVTARVTADPVVFAP